MTAQKNEAIEVFGKLGQHLIPRTFRGAVYTILIGLWSCGAGLIVLSSVFQKHPIIQGFYGLLALSFLATGLYMIELGRAYWNRRVREAVPLEED